MLTLEQQLLLKRLDSYIAYAIRQKITKPEYSTYFINKHEQELFKDINRTNTKFRLNLPITSTRYRSLTLQNFKVDSGSILQKFDFVAVEEGVTA